MNRFLFDPKRPRAALAAAWLGLAMAAATAPVAAQTAPGFGHGNGKLLLTGGVSTIEGAAGGGLTPWALIGGYGAENEVAGTAFATRVHTRDYRLQVQGAAVGIGDRLELSLAQQVFDADAAVPSATLRMNVAGVKLRLVGDAILDADRWLPQIALGAEWKRVRPGEAVGGVLDAVGARRQGFDVYLSATKLLLGQGVLVNGTLRATQANQNGLLGFGADGNRAVHLEPEASLAWLWRKDLAFGAEYRAKPDNLSFAGAAFREHGWRDVFVAWTPSKHFSTTLAWVDLGNIVGHERQTGAYLSIQLGY